MDVGGAVIAEHCLYSLGLISICLGDGWNFGAPVRLDINCNWGLNCFGAVLLSGLDIT